MKFYVTCENVQKLKRSFLNLKLFSIIDTQAILNELGYTYSTIDKYGTFIVNSKIMKYIDNYTKSKRIRGIIYSNPYINEEVINNLYDNLYNYKNIENIVLLDDHNVPKLQHLYSLFNEVIFFPSIKKIRLIEAQSITEVDPRMGRIDKK